MSTCTRFSASCRLLAVVLLAAVVPACGGNGGAAFSGAPTVGSLNPADNATSVPTSTNRNNVTVGKEVSATFSQAMNTATIDSSPAGTLLTFTLKQSAGTNVPGTVAMNAAHTMATFSPTASALLANTSYTATVTTAATNVAGMPITTTEVWSFTTNATAITGQSPVDLGLAGDYAIFADTGIANATVPAAITMNIGVGPGVTSTAITGFALTLPAASAFATSAQVTGKVYAFDYAAPTPTAVTTASTDMLAAYNDAAGRTLPDHLDLASGALDGLTLAPGLYRWGSNVTLAFGTNVTLSGSANDIWILQVSGTVTTAASTNVFLGGQARAKNIFWQVAGTTLTLGANAHFEGVVLAASAINLGNQATVNGRLLAQTAVNLDQNTVVEPAP